MLLPKKLLSGFLYFEAEYNQITKNYIDYGEDTIAVYRDIPRKFLKPKTVKDIYKFRRDTVDTETKIKFRTTNSYLELTAQLQKIQEDNWQYVDKDTYKILKENHPEHFL